MAVDDGETNNKETALVVGLGNPGAKHRMNRHNIGFMAVNRLAETLGLTLTRQRSKARVGKGRVDKRSIVVAKPQTYMNNSGQVVGTLVRFFKIAPQQMLVVYDDLDIPLGTLRLREKGGSGGHNGMKSVIQHVGTEFPRLRLGIGRPPGRMDPAAYVLRNFNDAEVAVLEAVLTEAVRAMITFAEHGIEVAMNCHNGSVLEENESEP